MPVHFISSYLSGLLELDALPTILACVLAIIFIRQRSSGIDLISILDRAQTQSEKDRDIDKDPYKLVKPKDLHGNVILVIGGFTAQGLLVCAQLSSLGAQLILLTPTLKSSYIMQMVHLLRDGTSNPLIYAEECDVTNLASVEAFAAQWNLGEGTGSQLGGLGAGPAGGLSGSTGLGAGTRGSSGVGQKHEKSGFAPRRVDSIVFLPLDSCRYATGNHIRRTSEGLECTYAELLGRFHLVNILLPSLFLLPPNRDIRIVTLLSPWYAAGAASLQDKKTLDLENLFASKASSRSPWTKDGIHSLLWLALSRELQRRIQLMTDADQRPRTKLPGIDTEGNVTGKATPTNVNFINVCAGFERGRDVLDYIMPSTGKDAKDSRAEWEDATPEVQQLRGADSDSQDQLKNLVDPRLRNRKNVTKGKGNGGKGEQISYEKEKMKKIRNELNSFEAPTILGRLIELIQYFFCICLWPLTWIFCKSPRRASETVTWATIAPIHLEKTFGTDLKGLAVVPGELHREGRIVRPSLPSILSPGSSTEALWNIMEKKAKQVLRA